MNKSVDITDPKFQAEADEIEAAKVYRATGDPEVLARYIASGGLMTDRMRELTAGALRGEKPGGVSRKKNAKQFERNREIVDWMTFLQRPGFTLSVEKTTEVVARIFEVSEETVRKIWQRRHQR